jgi:hypothetical protein
MEAIVVYKEEIWQSESDDYIIKMLQKQKPSEKIEIHRPKTDGEEEYIEVYVRDVRLRLF